MLEHVHEIALEARHHRIARVEELTRIPSETQDSFITVLSEKTLPIPELNEEVPAQKGFNLIATANNRDRGVNEMSAALKRRFGFETVFPIADLEAELAAGRDPWAHLPHEARPAGEWAIVPRVPAGYLEGTSGNEAQPHHG